MTRQELFEYMRRHKLAVVATVSRDQRSECALVGIAVTPDLELLFDTTESTRKCQNLRANSSVSFVIGWADEITLQYEGKVDEPKGDELVRCKAAYFNVYPDGRERERWPGITYFRVRPTWARYSNFNELPPKIVEMSFSK